RQGVRIVANDTVNNVNDSAVINFTIDFTSPNVTINSLNANTLFNASNYSVRSGNVTFNASIFDTLTHVNFVYFWLDNGTGNDINVTAINQSGDWIVSYNVSTLAEGRQGVRIIANDTVNNVNDTYFMNFTVDFTSPNVSRNFLNNPVNDSNFSIRSGNQSFNASIFDALTHVDAVYFWFDNGTSQDFNITGRNISGQWTISYNVSTLAEGRQGVRIIANDTVNNVNNSAVINFTVDFTAPTVNITGPAAGATMSGIRNFNATVRDSLTDVDKVLFQFSNGTNPFNLTASNTSGMWNVSINTNSIVEGGLTITVFANDTVGNINNTKTLSLTVDNIAEPGSGGGGPSSSTSTSTTNIQASEQKEWASLEIGEIATLEVKDKEIGITEISFTVSEEAYDVTLRVAKISYLPSSVSTFDGYAYQKLDISTESALAKDIFTEATIKFKVEKAWLADNQIAKEEVALYHYVNDKWITLPTKVGKDDNKYVYYSSKTPSFSYFVIGKKSSKEVLVKEPVEMPKEPPVSIPLIEPAETVKSEEGRLQKIFRSAEQLFVKTGRGLVALSKEAAEMSKTIAKKVITSVTEYTIYWLLTLILIVILLIALHIKDLPVPEFLWKLKQAPQVNVEEPIALPSPTEQKTDIHLRDWGKKNYIDLQQELKRVDALIKETPLPEQKNKALKLTALKTMQTQQKQSGSAVEQQKAIQKISPEETEQWAAHLLTSGTPAHQVVAIVHRATALNEAEIKAVLVKIRATQLLQKTYALTQKDSKELQEFIRTERKKGATIEQIIADLVREGWNERIVRLYVKAHYLVSPKCT
ncbi:MAG: PGF-pre-PGF domain-containing protein, partial [Nanoarchaeota archaeon]|nr:PGF-pre-PGF domain-containing protein [Nanoarchaeota archaeon]